MIEPAHFRPADQDGLRIYRNPQVHSVVTERAKRRLLAVRELLVPGTNLSVADHLSDHIGCQRKAVLHKREIEVLLARGGDPRTDTEQLTDEQIVFFGVGHAVANFLLGAADHAIWSNEHQLWYSPDGVPDESLDSYVEIKTSRRSPLKKADREAGLSVEDVLLRDNESWWRYILGVMKLENRTSYHLEHMWIISAEMEGFTVEASEARINDNWQWLTERRSLRRHDELNGGLPGVDTRRGAWECENCSYLTRLPCSVDVPRINAAAI